MSKTAIAVTEKSVGEYVSATLPNLIKSYAVRNYDQNAWMKSAALAIVENADLMACLETEAGRISLKHALRFAATTGLSLNPQEGKAALVPIGGKISYWPMKNGLVELLLETGHVSMVRMNAIRQNDGWSQTQSIHGDDYQWKPARRNRGEIDGFFCAVLLKDGTSVVEHMPREEVEEWRKSKSPKSTLALEAYGIKTVTKRMCNRIKLPKGQTAAIDAALAVGDAEPVTFEEAGKGASAGDVEQNLSKLEPAARAGTTGPGSPLESAGAPGAQGSAPAEVKQEKLDIF